MKRFELRKLQMKSVTQVYLILPIFFFLYSSDAKLVNKFSKIKNQFYVPTLFHIIIKTLLFPATYVFDGKQQYKITQLVGFFFDRKQFTQPKIELFYCKIAKIRQQNLIQSSKINYRDIDYSYPFVSYCCLTIIMFSYKAA